MGADPTLHDYRGPDIRLVKHGYIANATHIRYVLTYYVFDPSGVKRTTVQKNGIVRYRDSPGSLISRHNGSFKETGLGVVGDHLAGAKVEITATDRHDNRETAVGIRKANAIGQLAGKLDSDTIYAEAAAAKLGRLSGFSTGIGVTIKSVLGFVDDPLGFVESLGTLFELLDEKGLDIISMFIDSMAASLEDRQRTNNPYSKGSDLYDEYRYNWYAGYTVAFITKAIAGAQAMKLLKSSTLIQKVSDFAKSTRAGKATMRVKAPYDRGKARVATGLARGTKKAADPVLRRATSAGATYRLWQLQRKGDVDTTDLSKAERKRVSVFLAQHGEDGATTLRWMDEEAFRRLFRKACDGGSPGALRTGGGGCTKLTKAEQRAYGRAVGEADVGLGRFYKKIDEAGVSETAAERFVAQNGPAAIRLSVRMDSKAFGRLVEMDADAQEAVVRAWRSDNLEVSTVDVESVVRRVDSLEAGKRTKAIRLLEDAEEPGVKFIATVSDDTLEKALAFDIGNSRQWRVALAKNLVNSEAVTKGDIQKYVNKMNKVRKYAENGKIGNARGLVNDLANNHAPGKFFGAELEADRAVYYVKKTEASEVVVEPIDEIDFKLKMGDKRAYIEAKNAKGKLDDEKIWNGLEDHRHFDNAIENDRIKYEEDDDTAITFGGKRRGVSNNLGDSKDEIRERLSEIVRNFYPNGLDIKQIRIVMPDGDVFVFEVDELYQS